MFVNCVKQNYSKLRSYHISVYYILHKQVYNAVSQPLIICKRPSHDFCLFDCNFFHLKKKKTTNNNNNNNNNQQPTTNNQQPTTNKQPTTNNQQPTTNNKQQITTASPATAPQWLHSPWLVLYDSHSPAPKIAWGSGGWDWNQNLAGMSKSTCYCWWQPEIRPSPVDNVGIFSLSYLQGFIHPRWLFGISEPSTVSNYSFFVSWKLKQHIHGLVDVYYSQVYSVRSTHRPAAELVREDPKSRMDWTTPSK